MSTQESTAERKVFIGDAIIWNSRRIEKLEEVMKDTQTNVQGMEKTVELQTQLKMLQGKYEQLQQLVEKLEASVEASQHVSLNITEDGNESD